MSSSWIIEPGYNSGFSTGEDAWQAMQEIAAAITVEELYAQAQADNAPAWCCNEHCTDLRAYCAIYWSESDGNPLRTLGNVLQFTILASGVGGGRRIKEYVARAYCALFLQKANRRGIDITIRSL